MSQVYYNGDFWYAAADTVALESPAVAPAKWVRLSIPADLRSVIGGLAAASILMGQDKFEKAGVLGEQASGLLDYHKGLAARRDRYAGTLPVRN